MKKSMRKRALALGLTVLMTVTALPVTTVHATGEVTKEKIDTVLKDTAKYLYQTVKEAQVGSIGGEWAVIGLARSGYDVPDEWFEAYYDNLEEYTIKKEGVLHKKKYTDYSRVTLALTAIGGDPADVAGYDLLKPLGDFDKTIWQGINGWATSTRPSGRGSSVPSGR